MVEYEAIVPSGNEINGIWKRLFETRRFVLGCFLSKQNWQPWEHFRNWKVCLWLSVKPFLYDLKRCIKWMKMNLLVGLHYHHSKMQFCQCVSTVLSAMPFLFALFIRLMLMWLSLWPSGIPFYAIPDPQLKKNATVNDQSPNHNWQPTKAMFQRQFKDKMKENEHTFWNLKEICQCVSAEMCAMPFLFWFYLYLWC